MTPENDDAPLTTPDATLSTLFATAAREVRINTHRRVWHHRCSLPFRPKREEGARMLKQIVFAGVIAASLSTPLVAAAQVSINVAIVPPPVIFPAPPRVVVVPNTPVAYVPTTTYNVFFFDGRYWSFHEGAWFLATSYRGPWVFVPVAHVPRPLIEVPVRYYKVPPGHAKKFAHEEGRGRDWDRGDHDRGGGPPGRGHGRH